MRPLFVLAVALAMLAAGCAGSAVERPANDTAPSPALPSATPAPSIPPIAVSPAATPPAPIPRAWGEIFYTGMPGGEPTMGVTSSGAVFVLALVIHESHLVAQTYILRSKDGGASWEDATARVGPVPMQVETNDPLMFIDPDTDRIFHVDMHGPAGTCNTVVTSDDEGETWIPPRPACLHAVNDHPTIGTSAPRDGITVGYPKFVHVCSNMLVRVQCLTSADGGLTFPRVSFPYENELGGCGATVGHLAATKDGLVLLPKNTCGDPELAISADDGATWKVSVAAPRELWNSNDPRVDPSVAVDDAGRIHYAFLHKTGRIHVATSLDNGETWLPSVDMGPPEITAMSHMAIAAIGESVAIGYYGTRTPGGYSADAKALTWHGFMALAQASDTGLHTIETAEVTPPGDPLVRGPCGPGRCPGVVDFMDVQFGPDGRPWAAFVDACTGTCATGETPDNNDTAGLVATLHGVPNPLRPDDML